MLRDQDFHATIPAADLERARAFYEEKLGFQPAREEPAGLVYETPGGGWFRLYLTPNAGTALHTLAGWSVTDIETEVAELKSKGVVFEEYDAPGLQMVDGIATSSAGRAAWFRESEGNILGVADPAP
jgi:catechol 2,3-dioxygenase-like lactoylglutathione lyase family enzyme